MKIDSKRHPLLIPALVLAGLGFSGAALAQRSGPPGAFGMGPGGGRGPGFHGAPVVVAPDGTALYVKSSTTTSGSTTTRTEELVAINSSGAVAWTWTPTGAIRGFAFSGAAVAVAVVPQPSSPGASVTSSVVSLVLATGTQAWSASLNGVVGELKATPTGFLCTVSTFIAGSGTSRGSVSRALVALDNTGKILWTTPLD